MRHSNVYEERSLGIYADHEPDGSGAPAPAPAPLSSTRHPSIIRRLSRSDTAADIGLALTRTFTGWQGVGVPGGGTGAESRINFINQQIRGQLAHDIWWLVLAVFLITSIESSRFAADPVAYSAFNVIFEVVSAYGCVGISVGLPDQAYSFSGGWHAASKVLLCVVMLRGRHRGLPVALDHAVRLPGEQLHRDEEEDYRIRRTMTIRKASLDA
jgi:Trk-type K+ transport system membrane component